MDPTPLQHLRHQKGWRLITVAEKLKEKNTPVSWPTLVNFDRGYRAVIIRDKKGNKVREEKRKYSPGRHTCEDIARLFKANPEEIYQDRSKE